MNPTTDAKGIAGGSAKVGGTEESSQDMIAHVRRDPNGTDVVVHFGLSGKPYHLNKNHNYSDFMEIIYEDGEKPVLPMYAALLGAHGGTLIVPSQKQYRISVVEQGQPFLLEGVQCSDKKSGLFYKKKGHTIHFATPSSPNIGLVEKNGKNFEIQRLQGYTCEALGTALDSVLETNGQINVEKLLNLVPKLDSDMVICAVTDSRAQCEIQGKVMGEMVFQQLIYSCLSRLFMAAAGGCHTERYAADQNVQNSLSVEFEDNEGEIKEGKLTMQPDAAATIGDRRDAFGMMEIKPESGCVDQLYRSDNDKCVLMTAATSLVLSHCFPDKLDEIALPFVVATGHLCCLYVTRIGSQGPYVEGVKLSRDDNSPVMPVDCSKSPSPSKSRVVVALAVLLNNFLEFFSTERDAMYRSTFSVAVKESLPSVFTRRPKGDENADEKSSKSQKTQSTSTPGRGNSGAEGVAMEAAACGNLFRQIEYPWTRVVHFTDSDLVFEEQKESPFYFQALRETDGKKVFLKVWNSLEVETDDVENELRLQCKAYQAGVSVATPVNERVLRSRGKDNAEYLVLAMEFVESDSVHGALDCILFSSKLIETVESLHTAAGMLHGDLKPQNVRWHEGVVTLIDFGRSSSLSSVERSCSRGTEGYEAPEILHGDSNTTSTDAFAVGKIILRHIECLSKDEADLCSGLKEIAEGLASENPETRWSLTRASEAVAAQENRSEEPEMKSSINTVEHLRSPPKKIAKKSAVYHSVAVS